MFSDCFNTAVCSVPARVICLFTNHKANNETVHAYKFKSNTKYLNYAQQVVYSQFAIKKWFLYLKKQFCSVSCIPENNVVKKKVVFFFNKAHFCLTIPYQERLLPSSALNVSQRHIFHWHLNTVLKFYTLNIDRKCKLNCLAKKS